MAPDISKHLALLGRQVEKRLPQLLPAPDRRPETVHRAMHYALTSPGKRLRPVLTLAVAEMFGVRGQSVVDLACSVEMVHACSLILDDLPSMDDARFRRGRATVHIEFGEDVAILAAFALFNRAFELVAESGHRLALSRYTTEDISHHLASSIGTGGLIGGQALDLESRQEDLDLERLEYIHSHKTGALFIAAGEMGAMAADARRRDLHLVSRFAKNLGLAFQITDDVLDVTGTTEEIGKETGADADKVTFVKLLGVEGSQLLVKELLQFAVDSLAPLGRRADPLRELAAFVEHRSR
jgi:geranylgeranyl diphosphate synthase type II